MRAPLKVAAFASRENAKEVGQLVACAAPCFLNIDVKDLPFLIAFHTDIINGEFLDRVLGACVAVQIAGLNGGFRLSHLECIGEALNDRNLDADTAASLFNRAQFWINGEKAVHLPDLDWPTPWAVQTVIEDGNLVAALRPDQTAIVQTEEHCWTVLPVQDWFLKKLGVDDVEDTNDDQFSKLFAWSGEYWLNRLHWLHGDDFDADVSDSCNV
jgi:hypothetical protein